MSSSFHLLVIEDDTHTMTLIHTGLRGTGIEIFHALNSQAGLEMMAEVQPHLVLVDLLLPGPGMKGWEMIGYIKQQPEYSHIPLIAMSAGSYDIMELAQQAGCDGFLQKPFNLKELHHIIDQYRA